MDTGNNKEILEMYNLTKQKEAEANAQLAKLRAEIGDEKANEIDTQVERIVAEIKAKAEAKAAKKQEKKDNQVNCCHLF